MRAFKFVLLLPIMLASRYGWAQEPVASLEERLSQELLHDDTGFLTFTIENDNFGKGTDQNYTSGVRLTYFEYSADPPDFSRFLDSIIPTFEVNETTSIYYSLGQNLYTPEDIVTRTPDPEDRPYAAFLYGSMGLTSLTHNHIDEIEVTLGMIGPSAFGEEIQKFIHDILDADDPSGWKHQLKNEPGLILSWQRQWPEAYAAEFTGLNLRVSPHVGMTLGNIYTYGSGGLTLQLTPEKYKWQTGPLRVRPAIPGSGFFMIPDNAFAWSLFAGIEGRALGRNIFLDGNTFAESASVDKRHLVADANAGFSIAYGRTLVSYTLNWRSKEFENQKDDSLFGAVSIGYRF